MNLTRLIILGLLADQGPRHGHQLRRDAELAAADEWAGVGVGSLHRELHRLEDEDLVEPLRTERIGKAPERTIYQITDDGRSELSLLRRQAFTGLTSGPDPVSVALVFAAPEDPAELAALMAARKQEVRAELDRLATERTRGEAQGYLLSPVQAASFRRAEIRAAGELVWHEEWDALHPTADAPEPATRPS
jgi:DNA-binding PadR family transcriptional regulator